MILYETVKLLFLPLMPTFEDASPFAMEQCKGGCVSLFIYRKLEAVARGEEIGLDGVDCFLLLANSDAKEFPAGASQDFICFFTLHSRGPEDGGGLYFETFAREIEVQVVAPTCESC